jgi:hypothetical protein
MDKSQPPASLPADVLDALRRGNKIEAIKRMRDQTGLGLKEAKDAVEAYQPARGSQTQGSAELDAGQAAPGEVPRRTRAIGWAAALLAIGLVAAYYLIRQGA